MCYPCTQCGKCRKFEEDSPFYTPPAVLPCFKCGEPVSPSKGVCDACGYVAFSPPGVGTSEARGGDSQ